MKRILSVLAAAALMSAACIPAFAAGKPTFSVTDASGKPGEEVTVRCEIKDNPGIIAFHLLVDYDTDALTLTNASGGVFTGTDFGDTAKAPYSFLWADAVSGNYTDNGTIAELTFKIREGASAGDRKITLSYDPEDVFNYDMENVHFETEAGKITVSDGSNETPIIPADSSKAEESSSAADSKQEPPKDLSSAAGEENSTPENASSEEAPDSSEKDVLSQTESSTDKMSEADSLSSESVPEKDSSSAGETSSETVKSAESLASPDASDSSRESSDNITAEVSSAAEENKSSAAPIAIIVLTGAAVGGAVFIIIMKKRKE